MEGKRLRAGDWGVGGGVVEETGEGLEGKGPLCSEGDMGLDHKIDTGA